MICHKNTNLETKNRLSGSQVALFYINLKSKHLELTCNILKQMYRHKVDQVLYDKKNQNFTFKFENH